MKKVRADQNYIYNFIDNNTYFKKGSIEKARFLYDRYEDYCIENNENSCCFTTFINVLNRQGIKTTNYGKKKTTIYAFDLKYGSKPKTIDQPTKADNIIIPRDQLLEQQTKLQDMMNLVNNTALHAIKNNNDTNPTALDSPILDKFSVSITKTSNITNTDTIIPITQEVAKEKLIDIIAEYNEKIYKYLEAAITYQRSKILLSREENELNLLRLRVAKYRSRAGKIDMEEVINIIQDVVK